MYLLVHVRESTHAEPTFVGGLNVMRRHVVLPLVSLSLCEDTKKVVRMRCRDPLLVLGISPTTFVMLFSLLSLTLPHRRHPTKAIFGPLYSGPIRMRSL